MQLTEKTTQTTQQFLNSFSISYLHGSVTFRLQRFISMGKAKKVEQNKLIVVEFKVPMHCNACERTVVKVISKFKGTS